MGNYRFRLSDMMPNAWFYKLKDMGSRTRNHNTIKKKQSTPSTTTQPTQPMQQPNLSRPRHSYYFSSESTTSDRFYNSPVNPKATDTHFPDPPRKSSKRRPKRRTTTTTTVRSSPKLVTSSVSSGCSCRATLDSVWTKSDDSSSPDNYSDTSPVPVLHEPFLRNPKFGSEPVTSATDPRSSSSCRCRVSSSTTDIIIDVDRTRSSFDRKFESLDGFDSISELELPPILTKPAKFNEMIRDIRKRNSTEPSKLRKRNSAKLEEGNGKDSVSVKIVKEQRIRPPVRRSSMNSPRLKLRANSPRLASRKLQAYGRKSVSSTTGSRSQRRRSLSESMAVVKSSCDPQRDFRDSMVEMIVENNIRASKDLEELLACYLSLNSDEYHNLIVKVFEQIWFDLTDIRR